MSPVERIFAFDDPVDFLNFELRERQKRDGRFSLRQWSRQVGYENPSYLSHVLKRKRRLKLSLARKLAGDLSLKGKPLKYFELIVLRQDAGSPPEKEAFGKMIAAARPKKFEKMNQLSLETFSLISDWYHVAILEMTELKGGIPSPQQIHRRLGGRVNIRSIRGAIDRLLRAGLLVRDERGQLRRAVLGPNQIKAPLPVTAVNSYHRQMAALALEAVDSQSYGERDFNGTTLSFRRENYQKAREIIQEAHRQILRLAEKGTGEEIYQFHTQLFRLTHDGKK